MAAGAEIFSLLINASKNRLNYCIFCLRTESERRLVKPASFLQFLSFYKPVKSWPTLPLEAANVCYMCEVEVRRALTLLHAMDFAIAVQRCLNQFQGSLWTASRFHSTISKHVASREGLNLTTLWKEVRSIGALSKTEVLMVTSDMPTSSHQNQTRRDERLLDPEVVVIDDDTPPPSLPTLVDMHRFLQEADPRQATVVRDKMILMSRCGHLERILVHEMISKNGAIYIPTLKAKLQRNTLVHSDCEGLCAQEPKTYTPTKVQAGKNFGNEEPDEMIVIVESNGTDKSNLTSGQGTKKKSVIQLTCTNNDVTNNGVTPQKPIEMYGPRNETETDMYIEVDTNNQVNDQGTIQGQIYDPGKTLHLNGGTLTCIPDQECLEAASEQSGRKEGYVPATPAVMSGRIDWEDKIPMDVISFMDATDPNAEKLLSATTVDVPTYQSTGTQMQSEGFMPMIQNIETTTLEHFNLMEADQPENSNKRRREEEPHCIVIDLC